MVGLQDTTVYAIADGTVQNLVEPSGFGTYVRQTIYDGLRVYYGHLKKHLVANGSYVHKGDAIGIMGSTGRSTGAHTHLEMRVKGTSKESLDIAEFCGIDNACGEYFYLPLYECLNRICSLCCFDTNTKKYLQNYKYAEDLCNKLYYAMVMAKGYTPSPEPITCACNIETKAKLSKATMSYLWAYKFSPALMTKLWARMA